MISAKNIYHTYAYKQMKAYCKGDKAKLKELVQQFVDNRNNPVVNISGSRRMKAKDGLLSSFLFHTSPQGHAYWFKVSNVIV